MFIRNKHHSNNSWFYWIIQIPEWLFDRFWLKIISEATARQPRRQGLVGVWKQLQTYACEWTTLFTMNCGGRRSRRTLTVQMIAVGLCATILQRNEQQLSIQLCTIGLARNDYRLNYHDQQSWCLMKCLRTILNIHEGHKRTTQTWVATTQSPYGQNVRNDFSPNNGSSSALWKRHKTRHEGHNLSAEGMIGERSSLSLRKMHSDDHCNMGVNTKAWVPEWLCASVSTTDYESRCMMHISSHHYMPELQRN